MAEKTINKELKILSYQPFSVFGNGGGPRILRRLIEGRESELQFISFTEKYPKDTNKHNEIPYVLFPPHKKWMRSYLRSIFYYIRNTIFYKYNAKKVREIATKQDFDVLHIVDHSLYSNILIDIAKKRNLPVWSSFHDHFNTTGSFFNISKEVWLSSDKRMVISHEMGQQYCELFGEREYIIVTDGLKPFEISPVKSRKSNDEINIYFGGLLHIDYYELFQKFCLALEKLSVNENVKITLTLRGTQKLNFVSESILKINYRPFSINSEELRSEMDLADLLYLPMKYTDMDFYKYSFSTKMIGYLGASGNTFYHGPSDSAAAKFIEREKCGLVCDSLDPDFILECIKNSIKDFTFSERAKEVARNDFQLQIMQDRFFNEIK